jgi:hypothetical protein
VEKLVVCDVAEIWPCFGIMNVNQRMSKQNIMVSDNMSSGRCEHGNLARSEEMVPWFKNFVRKTISQDNNFNVNWCTFP